MPGAGTDAAGRAARLPLRRVTSEQQFELGGTLNGTLVTEASTTTFTYGDGYGNPTQVQTLTTEIPTRRT